MSGEWFALIALTIQVTVLSAGVFFLWVEVRAMQKSTHTIQYVDPLKNVSQKEGMQDVTDAVKSKLHEDAFDNII